ncbi:hypothetical protein [Paenibacillus sp. EKM212P]|uniref:hypothetical protein n=1 Tax=Paenibacillus sp. EKM212P TaxID=1683680 RepID=UPI0018873AEF|nr:hypothetical protein [Paenibacillus sp. EKM212P]
MAKIKSALDIQVDLTRPVEELTEVISAVIASQPARRKEILIGLDIAVGSALAEIQAAGQCGKTSFKRRERKLCSVRMLITSSAAWTTFGSNRGCRSKGLMPYPNGLRGLKNQRNRLINDLIEKKKREEFNNGLEYSMVVNRP